MRPLAALLAAAALAGCGETERPARPPEPQTRLRVTVYPEGMDAGQGRVHTVTCPGDDACARLRRKDLAPVPADVACTKIYGGAAEATVTGRLAGRPVDARFDLTGGCEIARWKDASYLLGPIPG